MSLDNRICTVKQICQGCHNICWIIAY